MLEAIRYRAGMLEILDQLRLPHESHYLTLPDAAAAWEAIHSMKVLPPETSLASHTVERTGHSDRANCDFQKTRRMIFKPRHIVAGTDFRDSASAGHQKH
ncbi:hypothetical protein HPB51_022663 [Rhipicephalus microplus]|uniref:Uncharacterized protein n=1 Tax=Rhipicephalus microplus TaxID=6941 RepID=A0A9J6E3K3_RHIMP|nr:hypothetical protein HPB51_022663 [Rhipicephalus microplus]